MTRPYFSFVAETSYDEVHAHEGKTYDQLTDEEMLDENIRHTKSIISFHRMALMIRPTDEYILGCVAKLEDEMNMWESKK